MPLNFVRKILSVGTSDHTSHHDSVPDLSILEPVVENDFEAPFAVPVHIVDPSAKLKIVGGELIIQSRSKPDVRCPIEQISAIHFHGGGNHTSSVITELAKLGRPVIWRSYSGYPVCWSSPINAAGLEIRRNQYILCDKPEYARKQQAQIVRAKILNMRGLLRRRQIIQNTRSQLGKELKKYALKALNCNTREQLLGVEGAATKVYFQHFGELLKNHAKNQAFDGRTRRPPRDLSNAALSYLYMVLAGECVCALVAAGLDPRCGVYHQDRAGKPALALDLIEAFRAPIVDASVSALLNSGEMKNTGIENYNNGCLLSVAGKRIALKALEKRYNQAVKRTGTETSLSWRNHIHRDALELADAFRKKIDFLPMVYA